MGRICRMTFAEPVTSPPATAILSALAEEQHGLIERLHQPRKVLHAGREFWLGDLHGQPVVLAVSKIGKVAAATTATALIERFAVRQIVFTGVAGGMADGVNVGDVVVAVWVSYNTTWTRHRFFRAMKCRCMVKAGLPVMRR